MSMRKNSTSFRELVERYRQRLTDIACDAALAESNGELVQNAKMMMLLADEADPRLLARQFDRSISYVKHMRMRFILLGLPGLHGRAPSFHGVAGRISSPAPWSGLAELPPPSVNGDGAVTSTGIQVDALP